MSEQLNRELNEILLRLSQEEHKSLGFAPHVRGSLQRGDRLAQIADLCTQRYQGDLIEIGCYTGETTIKLAEIARRYQRRVIAIDPWQAGTQNCEGWEYDAFLHNTKPYADILDIVRASSLEEGAIRFIKNRTLCFALVDGLHQYSACLSDIRTVEHCQGIIAVDDICWNQELMQAFRQGAHDAGRMAIHHPLCREGYLLPPTGV